MGKNSKRPYGDNRAEDIRAAYKLAKETKGEDRITSEDVKLAKKALNIKKPVPVIKDYMSQGGEVEVMKGKDYIKDLID